MNGLQKKYGLELDSSITYKRTWTFTTSELQLKVNTTRSCSIVDWKWIAAYSVHA